MTSELGQGTTAQIRLPLTLAIMAALLVRGRRPRRSRSRSTASSARSASPTRPSAPSPAGACSSSRDGVLPLVDAAERARRPAAPTTRYAVIVRGAGAPPRARRLPLIGQRELVTRPLPADLAELAPVSGGAVLSNGEIALIVDCDALADRRPAPAPPRRLKGPDQHMTNARYTDLQLDALRELANIGSGTAGTALSLAARQPDRAVRARARSALELADAVEAAGAARGPGRGAWSCRSPATSTRRRCSSSATTTRARCARCSASRPTPRPAARRWARSATSWSAPTSARSATMTGFELDLRPPSHARHARRRRGQRPGRPQRRRTSWRSCSTPSSRSPARPARCPSCCCPTPAGVAELLHRIGLGD